MRGELEIARRRDAWRRVLGDDAERDPAVGDFKCSEPIVFLAAPRRIRRVLTRVVDPVVQLEDGVFLEIERRLRSTTNGDTV